MCVNWHDIGLKSVEDETGIIICLQLNFGANLPLPPGGISKKINSLLVMLLPRKWQGPLIQDLVAFVRQERTQCFQVTFNHVTNNLGFF
jgi:hypothetical protein